MAGFLAIVGILELVGGVLIFAGSETVIHEILGQLAVGFAFLTLGLASLVDTAQKIRSRLDFHVARTWRDDKLADRFAEDMGRPEPKPRRWPWSGQKKRLKAPARTAVRAEPRL